MEETLGEMRKTADGERVSVLSSVIMTAIGFFEISVGFFAGSLALIGDAVDSFSDAATSLVVWVGLRISKRDPDGRFHFGYLRAETFYSMLGAIIIAGVGLVVMSESYTKLWIVRELKYGNIAIETALIAMVISTVMLIYKIKVARSLRLLSLKAEVVNSATDTLSSISAFLGITLADKFGIIQFDSVVGLVIGVFVLVSSYMIIKESSLILMDACSCHDVRTNLEMMAKTVSGVKGIKNVRLRKMGSYIAGDIVILVDGRLSVKEANGISKKVEETAQKLFDIKEIVVKVEPSEN
ncbi:MAG: cation diffusion facilitator family transporter [Candidatus Bathyarchaeia archaeon]